MIYSILFFLKIIGFIGYTKKILIKPFFLICAIFDKQIKNLKQSLLGCFLYIRISVPATQNLLCHMDCHADWKHFRRCFPIGIGAILKQHFNQTHILFGMNILFITQCSKCACDGILQNRHTNGIRRNNFRILHKIRVSPIFKQKRNDFKLPTLNRYLQRRLPNILLGAFPV